MVQGQGYVHTLSWPLDGAAVDAVGMMRVILVGGRVGQDDGRRQRRRCRPPALLCSALFCAPHVEMLQPPHDAKRHQLTLLLSTVKDKAQHAVILDKTISEKLYKDVQSYRLVTVATLVDRLKINGSLARTCLKDLEEKGQIKPIVTHSKMKIYSTSPRYTVRCAALHCHARRLVHTTRRGPSANKC